MSVKSPDLQLLSVPSNIGREIVESAALIACPLLSTDKFVDFCKQRAIDIDRARLLRLECLGLFEPVFRVRTPDAQDAEIFSIPVQDGNNWFDRGWAWDPTNPNARKTVPDDDDRTQEGYYSIFQIDWLRLQLSTMTLRVCLDAYLADGSKTGKLSHRVSDSIEHAQALLEIRRKDQFRRAIALLCQFVSNRYYPSALGDMRSIRVRSIAFWDRWINVEAQRWNWNEEALKWDPKRAESLFDLTERRLAHAYKVLAADQASLDPLSNWYPLVQFVSIDQRQQLRGAALMAQTLREGALMLRRLYADLYGCELPPPDEVHVTIIKHVPELEVRKDARRYLEFVVNRYGLNPQPKLVLFLEGESEERVVNRLFADYFGVPASSLWIEIVNVRGVNNATGGRKDRYAAILRLVDYLHHHQTLTFIVLDNENHAKDLKRQASNFGSLFRHRVRATRPEYIRVWRRSFEFDNFSDREIASALGEAAGGGIIFSRAEVARCRASSNPGSTLTNLYKDRTGRDIQKPRLGDILVGKLLSGDSRKAVGNRLIIKLLERVVGLATRNNFPVMQEAWESNQKSKLLAKRR